MLKERIQEILEFTKSESPYRKANKGWINQDIFLDLSPSSSTFEEKKESAKVTVFWSPINTLLSNIFLIIILSSILVFTSLSLAKGRLNFNFFNTSLSQDIIKFEDNKVVKVTDVKDLGFENSENEQNLGINELGKINSINSVDENQINSDLKITTTETKKQESLIKDKGTNLGIKNLENKKSKSNFI